MFVVRVDMIRATSNSIPCIAQLQYAPEVEFEDTELNMRVCCINVTLFSSNTTRG